MTSNPNSVCRCCAIEERPEHLNNLNKTRVIKLPSGENRTVNLEKWFLEFTHLDPKIYTAEYSKICSHCETQLLQTYEFRASLLSTELNFAKKTNIKELLLAENRSDIGSFDLPAGLKLELRETSKDGNKTTEEQPMIPCNYCQETFTSRRRLLVHMKIHVFKCGEPDCTEEFNTKSLLQFHLYQHREQEKLLVCSTCGKRYDTEDVFALHRKAHTEMPPVPCEECGKSFVLVQSLIHHQRADHPEKKCKLCSRSFNAGRSMKLHMLQHAGSKFKCDLCESTEFTEHTELLDHLKNHPNGPVKFDEKRHIVIPGRFRRKMESVTKADSPFACGVCQQAFENLEQLEEHEKLAETVTLDDSSANWQPVQDSIVVVDSMDVDADLIIGIIENLEK